MLVNFLKRRQPVEWSEFRTILVGLEAAGKLEHASVPDDPASGFSWVNGISLSGFLAESGPPQGWEIDLSHCILGPKSQGDLGSANQLVVTRGFSRRAIAISLARFYATTSRYFDETVRSRQMMLDILDSDAPIDGPYALANLIGNALLEGDTHPDNYSIDATVLSGWLLELNEQLATIGYEVLWAKAYRDMK